MNTLRCDSCDAAVRESASTPARLRCLARSRGWIAERCGATRCHACQPPRPVVYEPPTPEPFPRGTINMVPTDAGWTGVERIKERYLTIPYELV